MLKVLSKSIFLLTVLVVIVCGIYPFGLWIIAQSIFPFQANGSLLMGPDNKPMGSKLIAQPFTKEEYFQPRPSAASYDASASNSSALAASNPRLRDRVLGSLKQLLKYHNINLEEVPGDLVTTSASGLDPHITLQNAEYQLDRVSAVWASRLKRDTHELRQEIDQLLKHNSQAPFWGLIGEKFVNVLEVNFELYKQYGSPN